MLWSGFNFSFCIHYLWQFWMRANNLIPLSLSTCLWITDKDTACDWSAICMHAHSCPTLFDPVDCSPIGSSAHGILPARILEWVAILSFGGSFPPRDWTHVSCIGRQVLYPWATWEAHSQCDCWGLNEIVYVECIHGWSCVYSTFMGGWCVSSRNWDHSHIIWARTALCSVDLRGDNKYTKQMCALLSETSGPPSDRGARSHPESSQESVWPEKPHWWWPGKSKNQPPTLT